MVGLFRPMGLSRIAIFSGLCRGLHSFAAARLRPCCRFRFSRAAFQPRLRHRVSDVPARQQTGGLLSVVARHYQNRLRFTWKSAEKAERLLGRLPAAFSAVWPYHLLLATFG